MSRTTWVLLGGLILIGVILWALWPAVPGPMMLGGFSTTSRTSLENDSPLSILQAGDRVQAYLTRFGDQNLILAEVMAFDNHFYASVKERDSGLYAFELLVDRLSGQVVSEPGPNMMWNTKYGHMKMGMFARFFGAGSVDNEMAVSPGEAQQAAQQFLDQVLPGTRAAEEVDQFYGYYTLHILSDAKPIGMLSINGQSGQVWVHSWHGEFLEMCTANNAE